MSHADLTFETLSKAKLEDLVRLAMSTTLNEDELLRCVFTDDPIMQLARALVRWYKRNPQSSRKHRRTRADRRTERL